MTKKTLRLARQEARRFVEKVKVLEARMEDDHSESEQLLWIGSKESGAVRRSSMDLTRALSDLRKTSI